MTETLSQNAILRISDDKTLELIQLYEKEQCLWNTFLGTYKIREERVKAAQRIASSLNLQHFEGKHVMIKFKNLRNSYCQELKKIAHSMELGFGEDEVYKPKVFWFHKMDSFLRPHLQPARSINARPPFYKEEESLEASNSSKHLFQSEIKSEPDDHFEEVEEWVQNSNPEDVILPDETQTSTDDEAPSHKRKRFETIHHCSKQPKTDNVNSCVENNGATMQILHNISSNLEVIMGQKNDPFDSFGKYIASLLRSMPVQKAIDIQPKIVALVASAALNGVESRVSKSDENV